MVSNTVWLPELSNPTLLSAKMFLADFIYITNMPYDYDRHNCTHFAEEIQLAASKKGIRCGYAVLAFEDSEVGHAIIAFETDYGLKFFEPQNGNEEEVKIGRRYSAVAEGLSESRIVSKLEIRWNDGTRIHMH